LPKSKEDLQKELDALKQEQERQELERQVKELKSKVAPTTGDKLKRGLFGGLKTVAKTVASDMNGSWQEQEAQKKKKSPLRKKESA